MIRGHDFINGEYYEDHWTGERVSPTEYIRRQIKSENIKKGQHYILIKICEGKIKGKETFCDFDRWYYYADEEKLPRNIVILSENEYIKNEKGSSYYRRYKGDYVLLEVEDNIKLRFDKVKEFHGNLLCTEKGREILYTREEFYKKILN